MWTFQQKTVDELPEDVVGFVYQITNITNGRMYIGKKLARFKRSRPPLKGRKNKRRYKVDSDWRDYYGSSDELSLDIKKIGKQIQQKIESKKYLRGRRRRRCFLLPIVGRIFGRFFVDGFLDDFCVFFDFMLDRY